MERDFEREFKELKQSEIPDLWNRIEAGLSEKKNVILLSQNTVVTDNRNPVRKKRSSFRKWGTLIAACLCIFLIMPAFSLLIRNKEYSGGMGMESAADTAAPEAASCDTALSEEGMSGGAADSGAAAEETAEAGAAEAENTEVEAAEETSQESDGGMEDNAAPAEVRETGQMSSTEEASADASAEEKETGKAVWSELANGEILEEVVVWIQKTETAGEEMLCKAKVRQTDADGILEEEMQITIVCNAGTEYDIPKEPRDEKVLKEGKEYRVKLCYDQKKGRFDVLTAESLEE